MNTAVRRAVLALIVVAALATFVFAFTIGGGNDDEALRSGSPVERFVPENGSPAAVRQAEIGVDLAPGYTAVLLVDGVEIPEDQLRRNDPESQLFFTPGEGQIIESLAAGPHTATALVWRPVASETREDAEAFSWSFRAA